MPTLAFELTADYFLKDPVGQKITLGVGLVLALVVVYFVLKAMTWASSKFAGLIAGAVVIAGLYYAATFVFNMGATGWLVAGFVAAGAFVGFALFLTVGK